MQEAMQKGFKVGVVNSGSIIEPGTACFLSSVAKRDQYALITRQVLESGADVILSGGEEWMLPSGTRGRHTASGKRSDGKNLIEAAVQRGYTVVYTREELAAVPPTTKKLLGVFAEKHTFLDQTEDILAAVGMPFYVPSAPTVAEMTSAALRILGKDRFFLVVEEEGTDNFGNVNNARGVLEALIRADDAFRVATDFVEKHPDTLLITPPTVKPATWM
jgi:alkaline phosphatase